MSGRSLRYERTDDAGTCPIRSSTDRLMSETLASPQVDSRQATIASRTVPGERFNFSTPSSSVATIMIDVQTSFCNGLCYDRDRNIPGSEEQAAHHRIPREAEDVVDAVVLAPAHRLAAAVMAVAVDGRSGAQPAPADVQRQVLKKDANLGAGRYLVGAQENRHRRATLDMAHGTHGSRGSP